MMTSRDLQEALKRGAGMSDLCSRYDATSEDIESSVRRLYKQTETRADKILSRLDKNDKRAEKKQKRRDVEAQVLEETPAIRSSEVVPQLDAMKTQARNLSDDIIELELRHEELRNQRASLKREASGLSTELAKLRKQIVVIGDRYREKAQVFNTLGEEMLAISEAKMLKIGQLDELNARIEQMRIIELFIYNDGNIVAENRPDIELNEDGYQEIYCDLLRSDKDYLDLKKSQLLILAKIICIVNNLGDVNLSLAFDDDSIEFAYQSYMSSSIE